MRTLGLIPARGGSKGVPRKNLRAVAGRPLLAYTIDAARESRRLERFVISTEDAEIAEVAAELGCQVVRRPPELARDDTPMLPVVLHALATVETAESPFDCLAILQPTSPLRTSHDIDAALEILAGDPAVDAVIGVYRVEDHHPARMYRLAAGRLVPYSEEPASRLRQELPAVYHRNGAVYAVRRETIGKDNRLYGDHIAPYVMPRERSVNLDDELDLGLAEVLLRRRKGSRAS